ncbi:hypothetical protein [Micromonospora sp. U21]|uniref:hypothetical protein n=1 Tax=Micromonospora sp. U21 TaxID=2824899 RepID=UPI001B360217|nr:hypothetical protein [Micromonospora sp. U21]MBQ0901297.1 hypothetical protein [Micromonospora sp. U21]
MVQPDPELRAAHLRLRHRDQELTRGQTPIPQFDRPDRVIQRGGNAQPADQLGYRNHT